MKTKVNSPAACRFALLAAAGCASISAACAAQTLRYNFESVTDPFVDTVLNLAPGATVGGLFTNPDRITINSGEEVVVDSVRYQLGKTPQFNNFDDETTAAGYVDTGLSPSDWGMTNFNTTDRNYTAMAWVRFDSTTADNMVFGQFTGNSIHLGSRGGNLHYGHWGDDLGPDQGFNVPTGLNTWQHIAWVNQGNAQSMYKNGVLVVGPGATGTSTGDAGLMAIGSAQNAGSFIGSIDEVKVFGDQVLTAAEIKTEMTNTLAPVTLATVSSAKLNNTGFTFTIQDFVPNSLVNTASFTLQIDGAAVTPTSVTKSGIITTVVYNPPPPLYLSASSHTYQIRAEDQSSPGTPNIAGNGSLIMPVLPPSLPGPAGGVGSWGVREFRDPVAGAVTTAVDALRDLPAVDPDPGTNTIFDGTAPVMNHTDPDGVGDMGNFRNDLPYIGHEAGIPDDNIAFVGKTQVTITTPGEYTFSVHSDDGFAMRVGGGPAGNTSQFTSSNRASATNGIDPADPQTIFFNGGTGDSSTTGVYNFTAAGTYDILLVSTEGTGGSFYEVAWAPGAFVWDRDTTTWALVGNPADPIVTAQPFVQRFLPSFPGPAGAANAWGVRTYLGATTGSTVNANNWLRDNGDFRVPNDFDTFDSQPNILNLSDNYNADTDAFESQGYITPDDALPDGFTHQDNVITTAHGRIEVANAGFYTFNARGDDGFTLRIKGVAGPDPKFTQVSTGIAGTGAARLEMTNLSEMFFTDGTGDTQTRGVIFLDAGQYDLEYMQWEGGGGFWYELTGAAGQAPHGTEPLNGWLPVGLNYTPPPAAGLPQISAAGWTVESTLPGALINGNVAGALDALALESTTSTWDAVNFSDPQNAGGSASPAPTLPWPRNTGGDDNNFAMRAKGQLVVPADGIYVLGYQGDDGGYLIIRGTGGNPSPSFDFIVENASGGGLIQEELPGSGESNMLSTDIPTGNSRTTAQITLTAGTYDLEGLFFEIGGGAYWAILGGIDPVTGPLYPLSKGGNVPALSFLPLVAPAVVDTIPVTNFTYNSGTGAFSLTFTSEAGVSYQLDYSTAMAAGAAGVPTTWNPSGTVTGQAGSTTVTGNMADFQPGNGGVLPVGAPKVFLRIRR